MTEPDLDDATYSAFAWRRFRLILKWMALVSVLVAIGSLTVLWLWLGALPLHMAIATGLGIGLTIFLAAVLMGLMFLSSGSGYDTRVDEFNADRDPGRTRD